MRRSLHVLDTYKQSLTSSFFQMQNSITMIIFIWHLKFSLPSYTDKVEEFVHFPHVSLHITTSCTFKNKLVYITQILQEIFKCISFARTTDFNGSIQKRFSTVYEASGTLRNGSIQDERTSLKRMFLNYERSIILACTCPRWPRNSFI